MTIRPATPSDRLATAAVFADAVRTAGPSAYTPAQVDAWAAGARDPAAFAERMASAQVCVAGDAGAVAGFVSLDPDGRVGMLYVRGDRQRRGVGDRLLAAALAAAAEAGHERTYAEASPFSLPVFRRAGFRVTGTDVVAVRGARFESHLVERWAASDPPSTPSRPPG